MSKTITAGIIIALLLVGSVSAQNMLNAPEGIVYDYENNRYLVSNWNSGAIVQIDSLGLQRYFKTGLGNCSGMLIHNNILYVCCNNSNLVGLDLTTSATVLDMSLSRSGLHGITADTCGYLYASDWGSGTIYKIDPVAQTSTILTNSGLFDPLGLEYDPAHHRIIVVSFGGNKRIQQVDIATGIVTTIVLTTFPNFDDITRDQDGNYYISVWNDDSNWIYIYDTVFTHPPDLIVGNSNHGLIDLCYNRDDNILAHTDYWTNTVTYEQMKIKIESDISHGWVPFDVNFSGWCGFPATSWDWDLGNGATSTDQYPSTSYNTPGMHDINLTAITITDDTLHRILKNGIIALADTLTSVSDSNFPGEQIAIPIYLRNFVYINNITLPVEYDGTLALQYDSISLAGCRTESFENKTFLHYDAFSKRFTYKISSTSEILDSGYGPIAIVYFTIPLSATGDNATEIALDGYTNGTTTYTPYLYGPLLNYEPAFSNGQATVIIPSCCIDQRGNIDGDTEDEVNINDIVYFVDYSFGEPSGPEPPCYDEADVDGNGEINIGDLVYMVNYSFGSPAGPPPVGCF